MMIMMIIVHTTSHVTMMKIDWAMGSIPESSILVLCCVVMFDMQLIYHIVLFMFLHKHFDGLYLL